MLYQTGAKKLWTADDSAFNAIFTREGHPQLRLVFREYEQLTGQSIEKAIGGAFGGDMKNALLALAKFTRNPSAYFAELIQQSMKVGGGGKS